MLDILVATTLYPDEDITISSEEVSAVVFPCSSFECLTLWEELQTDYEFSATDLGQPRVTNSFVIDTVDFLGEEKEINVSLWCWKVKTVYLCYVEPFGDLFVRSVVEKWLNNHFNCTYDKGRRKAFFTPMNFHNCVTALREAINTKAIG